MLGKVLPCLLLAIEAGCWHVPRPAAPDRGAALELRVATFTLGNGLRVVIVPDPGDPAVRVTMRYAVGEVDDPPGQAGLSHLVEHVLYEPIVDGQSLFDRVETDAIDFAGHTSADATVYTERATPARLAEMLRLEAARLGQRCATVSAGAFQRQREIVRNELRERDDDDRLFEALAHALYPPDHPLHGASFGTPDSIAALTQAQACAFADAHYTPGNAVLVISGEVAASGIRPFVEQTFGAIQGTPRAPGAAALALPPTSVRGRVTVPAPVDRPEVVLAWPLPADPVARARVRAVGDMATSLVASRVDGTVVSSELGTGGARMFAIVMQPSRRITVNDAIHGARAALWGFSQWFASGLYEHAQRRVLYELLSSMTPGEARDVGLAEDAARGLDVDATIHAEVRGLTTLSEDGAAGVAHTWLAKSSSALVVLMPDGSSPRGSTALTHPLLERRPAPPPADPALAHRPAAVTDREDPLAESRVRTRTLANGMRVVLLPLQGTPTVDVRLVFGAGTADDPAGQRGVAMLAGYALGPVAEDATDTMKFLLAGGELRADVAADHTTFQVTGLAGYLDQLLLGLELTVRHGGYDRLDDVASYMKIARGRHEPQLAVELAWRFALYGDTHPYALGGLVQEVQDGAFEGGAVRAFRSDHYQPDDATLIIAGGFDPDVADRWIDYEFGDWQGHAVAPDRAPAALQPFAFAEVEGGPLLGLHVALPAGPDRAAALVATEMLSEAIADVREQLAASYGLRAQLVERRLSRFIEITGDIDAARAGDACALLRDRIAALREPSDATASRFVAARRHVLAQLRAPILAPGRLSDLAIEDLDVGRDLDSRATTADDVAALTLDRLAPYLANLDLSRAAMLLAGPHDAVSAAYATLGRTFAVTH